MRILFIGGTGIISSACARLVLASGHQLDLLVRGQSQRVRPYPEGAEVLLADVRDVDAARAALGNRHYDAVVDWVAFTPDQIEKDIELFRKRTEQFVFISSASAYKKPVERLPLTESTPLKNSFWEYSRNKIACEERLVRAYREEDFPITIVRPSHTYDRTLLPLEPHAGTVLTRMQQGKPVIVHGDGTSLWVLTHNQDFAVGLVGLLGHPAARGEAFHITSDEAQPWNQIYESVASALGVQARLVHVPSEVIARHDPRWGAGLLGDKAHSVIFDNTKIRRLVPHFSPRIPFRRGAGEIVEFFRAHPERLVVDPELDALMDRLATTYG